MCGGGITNYLIREDLKKKNRVEEGNEEPKINEVIHKHSLFNAKQKLEHIFQIQHYPQ
jgi:hypothetical protein